MSGRCWRIPPAELSHLYPFDVLLAGLGIGGPAHTTWATLELLRRARVVLTLSVHAAWLKRWCRRVVTLDHLYYTGEEDVRVYKRLADSVLDEARRGPGVAWVDDGHPLIYDDACHDIRRRGQQRGLTVVVLPAVSAIDALVADYGVSFDSTGLQVVEASSLVAGRQRLNPCFETLVLQLGWFGTSLLAQVEHHERERFAPLQDYLSRFYPPSHRVSVLLARQDRGADPPLVNCRLDRLAAQFRRIAVDSTLHLRPASVESEWDHDFEKGMLDVEHLRRIARLGDVELFRPRPGAAETAKRSRGRHHLRPSTT